MGSSVRHDNLRSRKQPLKYGDFPENYGQFLKDMTDATPGLRDWDGTMEITAKKYTASPGEAYFLLGSRAGQQRGSMVLRQSILRVVSSGNRGEDRLLNLVPDSSGAYNYGYTYTSNAAIGAIAPNILPYSSQLTLQCNPESEQLSLVLPKGILQSGHSVDMMLGLAVARVDQVGGTSVPIPFSNQQLAGLITVTNGTKIGPAVALPGKRALIFQNNAVSGGRINVGVMAYEHTATTFSPTFSSVTVTATTARDYVDLHTYTIRKMDGTAIYAPYTYAAGVMNGNKVDTRTYAVSNYNLNESTLSVSIGTVDCSDGLHMAVYGSKISAGTSYMRSFNDITESIVYNAPMKRAAIFSGVKQIGDGIGICVPTGAEPTRFTNPMAVAVMKKPGEAYFRFKEYDVPLNQLDAVSRGCCLLSNPTKTALYQMTATHLIEYKLVGVGPIPPEYQCHPYINHT
jgi:hypothetical protein